MQFKLPELGEGVHEGELVKWKVQSGDSVKYDQPLCEIMTDKATVEIPSAFQGKVATLHVHEGEVVKVGQLMLSFEGIGAVQEKAQSVAPIQNGSSHFSSSIQSNSGLQVDQQKLGPSSIPVFAAPATRRLAREMGIDLAQVQGTGPHGRIMKEDLQGKSGSDHSVLQPTKTNMAFVKPSGIGSKLDRLDKEERVPFKGLRKKIAEKMRLSKDHAAHFTYVEEADATQLVALRKLAKDRGAAQGIKVTYLPFIMKAMVASLKKFPILNTTLDEAKGELVYKYYYNIGLSIQTDEGLTAPVVKDVEHKTILELAKEIQDLVDRARAKRLTLEDLSGGTITLTNAGSIGGLFATPVINYPEVAILGFNKIFRKPVVIERKSENLLESKEEIVIRDWTYFSISLDHRVVDGAIGAEFMKLFIDYIENPSLLLL